jgi:hypothetical protein
VAEVEVEEDATCLGTEETETEGIEVEIGTATGIGGDPTQGTEIETETTAGKHSVVLWGRQIVQRPIHRITAFVVCLSLTSYFWSHKIKIVESEGRESKKRWVDETGQWRDVADYG